MLESVQTKGSNRCGVRMTEDAEDSTFLTQAVGVGIEFRIRDGPQILWKVLHRYRVPLALGCVNGSSER